jgi:hypothetical protein
LPKIVWCITIVCSAKPRQQRRGARTPIPNERPAFVGKEGRAVGAGQPVDDIAEKTEQRHLKRRDRRDQHRRYGQPGPDALGVVPAEGEQGRRRLLGRLGGKGIDTFFKPRKHGEPLGGQYGVRSGIGDEEKRRGAKRRTDPAPASRKCGRENNELRQWVMTVIRLVKPKPAVTRK